MECGKQKKHWL